MKQDFVLQTRNVQLLAFLYDARQAFNYDSFITDIYTTYCLNTFKAPWACS